MQLCMQVLRKGVRGGEREARRKTQISASDLLVSGGSGIYIHKGREVVTQFMF